MNHQSREDKPKKSDDRPATNVTAARNVAIVDNQIDSRDLFVATREIIIGHGDHHYRLRLTAQNKLILTK